MSMQTRVMDAFEALTCLTWIAAALLAMLAQFLKSAFPRSEKHLSPSLPSWGCVHRVQERCHPRWGIQALCIKPCRILVWSTFHLTGKGGKRRKPAPRLAVKACPLSGKLCLQVSPTRFEHLHLSEQPWMRTGHAFTRVSCGFNLQDLSEF